MPDLEVVVFSDELEEDFKTLVVEPIDSSHAYAAKAEAHSIWVLEKDAIW